MADLKTVLPSMYRGYLSGFGEGAGLPSLASRYTRAELGTDRWSEVGRLLGQMHGQHMALTPTGMSAMGVERFRETPAYAQLLALADRIKRRWRGGEIKPPPETASSGRRKQGPGFWMGEIEEESKK